MNIYMCVCVCALVRMCLCICPALVVTARLPTQPPPTTHTKKQGAITRRSKYTHVHMYIYTCILVCAYMCALRLLSRSDFLLKHTHTQQGKAIRKKQEKRCITHRGVLHIVCKTRNKCIEKYIYIYICVLSSCYRTRHPPEKTSTPKKIIL